MKQSEEKMPKKQKLLVLLCFLFYAFSYLGKYSYSANINPIMSDYGVNKATAGLALSCFFFGYGIGQIVHGIFCKFYRQKYLLPLCMVVSAGINYAVYAGVPFFLIKYLWAANGLLTASFWPSLLLTIGKNIEKRHLPKAIVAMSATTAVGTFLSYGLSAAFVAIGRYKLIFFVSATAMLFVALIFFLSFDKITSKQEGEKESESSVNSDMPARKAKNAVDFSVISTICALAVIAVTINLLKDGLHTWVPAILKDRYGLSDSLSILLTLALPIVGVFGAMFSMLVRKKIKGFVAASGAMSFLCFIVVFGIIFAVKLSIWLPLLLLFCAAILLTHAVNNTVTSVAPLFMREKVNSGLVAGILNGFCYVGSTISSYGLGGLADKSGWNAVFYVFLACCAISVIVSLLYELATRKRSR